MRLKWSDEVLGPRSMTITQLTLCCWRCPALTPVLPPMAQLRFPGPLEVASGAAKSMRRATVEADQAKIQEVRPRGESNGPRSQWRRESKS